MPWGEVKGTFETRQDVAEKLFQGEGNGAGLSWTRMRRSVSHGNTGTNKRTQKERMNPTHLAKAKTGGSVRITDTAPRSFKLKMGF